MGELTFENIFDTEESIDLFNENEEGSEDENEDAEKEGTEKKDNNNETEDVTIEELFQTEGGEDPESGGSENKDSGENANPEEGGGSSVFSSIAAALVEEGVLETLTEKDLKGVKTVDQFKELIKKEVDNKLGEEGKKLRGDIDDGVDPEVAENYNKVLSYLKGLDEEIVSEDSEDAELIRKKIILQDYLNKGFSKEKAIREVEKSLAAGTDIDDAIYALHENITFFETKYNGIIESVKQERERQKQEIQKNVELVKSKIMDTEEPFAGVKLEKSIREKVYKNVAVPNERWKDGRYYTKLQKFQLEKPEEFIHKIGVLFTLTDGFKNLDGIVKKQVKEKTAKTMSNLENVLKGTTVKGGRLKLINGGDDEEMSIHSDFKLDI